MEAIYENTESKLSSTNQCSYIKALQEIDIKPSTGNKDRDLTPSKATKVLLIVFCVCLVLAVVGLCVLGVLYYNKRADFESLTIKHNMVLMQLSIQEMNNTRMEKENHEFKAKYDRLRSSFYDAQSCNLTLDGWTVCSQMFYFSTDKQNWAKSRDVCVSMGADLVTITSKEEQEFLVSKIKETHWIGLNDLKTEGRWVWVNNQTLEETGVQFWFKRESGNNEPDNWKVGDPSGENCASLGDKHGNLHTWFDGSCEERKQFICLRSSYDGSVSIKFNIN